MPKIVFIQPRFDNKKIDRNIKTIYPLGLGYLASYVPRSWEVEIIDEQLDDIDFNMRLVWEFRVWDHPTRKNQHIDFDEILFDRFNLTMRNMFDMPLTGVIGRQDIILGKAWLVLDGTPLDGSRTIYLDAARFTYDWEEKDTKIDMIYIHTPRAD